MAFSSGPNARAAKRQDGLELRSVSNMCAVAGSTASLVRTRAEWIPKPHSQWWWLRIMIHSALKRECPTLSSRGGGANCKLSVLMTRCAPLELSPEWIEAGTNLQALCSILCATICPKTPFCWGLDVSPRLIGSEGLEPQKCDVFLSVRSKVCSCPKMRNARGLKLRV